MKLSLFFLVVSVVAVFEAQFSFGLSWGKSSYDNTAKVQPNPKDEHDYGVDWSFPIHRNLPKNTYFGNRYHTMIQGCYDTFSERECGANERARMEMNFDQPRSQHNYTEIGFKKMRAPEGIFKEILEFYQENRKKEQLEKWPRGNTYVNSWESPTYMISFEDRALRGGLDLKSRIWEAMKPIIEEWTGKKVIETSLYGIRVYKKGAVLATHVDRLPLVSSMIIQVDQDLIDPWPVEVYSHDGKAHNVTMKPGDIVLYESHTVLHGRPFPLNGNYYANIFVHYAPIDHDEMNIKDADKLQVKPKPIADMVPGMKKVSQNAGHEQDNHDEAAVKKHMEHHDAKKAHEEKAKDESTESYEYSEEYSEGENYEEEEAKVVQGRTALHVAAANGKLDEIEKLLNNHNTDILHAKDENSWQPIHEAARGGHLETLKYLVDMGADISAKTNNGGTPLWWARRLLDEDHGVIRYLESIGAPEEGSDL